MRLFKGLLAAAAWLLLLAAPASAEWRRAETRSFIVYGAGAQADPADMAEELEAFDRLLRIVTTNDVEPSPNKLEIYLVRNVDQMRAVWPKVSGGIAGFYSATTSATAAVVRLDVIQRNATGSRFGNGPNEVLRVLFHEYAHHFMYHYSSGAYPAWYSEGFAEFVSTAQLDGKRISYGLIDEGRVAELRAFSWIPLSDLLTKSYGEVGDKRATFYAQSWLLTHYLSQPTRGDKLTAYLNAIQKGEDRIEAFETLFGPIEGVEAALREYVRVKMPSISFELTSAPRAAVEVTSMPESADALLLPRLRLQLYEFDEKEPEFLAAVRQRAGRFPNDHFAALTLARAEVAVGDPKAALTALGDLSGSQDVEALYIAAMAHLRLSTEEGEDEAVRIRQARPLLSRAFAVDGNNYPVLYQYVRTFSGPAMATENNRNAAVLAHQLAPQVSQIRLNAAVALLNRREFKEAIDLLQPLANAPHGGGSAGYARRLIEWAKAGGQGTSPSGAAPSESEDDE